jgi:hypothetical protein
LVTISNNLIILIVGSLLHGHSQSSQILLRKMLSQEWFRKQCNDSLNLLLSFLIRGRLEWFQYLLYTALIGLWEYRPSFHGKVLIRRGLLGGRGIKRFWTWALGHKVLIRLDIFEGLEEGGQRVETGGGQNCDCFLRTLRSITETLVVESASLLF